MSNQPTPIQKLNRALIAINKLTDEEIWQIEGVARSQATYLHPLKHATQGRYNKLGQHNLEVMAKVKELRTILKQLKEHDQS